MSFSSQLENLVNDDHAPAEAKAEARMLIEELPEEVNLNRAWGDAGLDGPERTFRGGRPAFVHALGSANIPDFCKRVQNASYHRSAGDGTGPPG